MRLSKKGWIMLTTLLAIALIFGFYFLVYVKDKESQLITNKMRVLNQIRGNIELLIQSEKKIRVNEQKELNGREDDELPPGWYRNADSISDQPFFWSDERAIWNIKQGYGYGKAYQELFGKELIERKDVFEFIAIAIHDQKRIKTLFSNFPLGFINFPQDSSMLHFSTQNIFEVDFGYGEYIVFNTLISEQASSQVYLTGFVNKTQFNKEKREVSVFIITIAIVLLTLMILGLPLLKIQVMSNAERLGAKDVFLAGASLVLTPTVLVFFFFLFIANISSDKSREEPNLKKLNEQLTENFKTELSNALTQLKLAQDSLHTDLSTIRARFGTEKPYRNNPTGQYAFPHAWKNSLWREDFKYFNSIFWTDRQGIIKIYLSSEEDPTKIDSLGYRNYIMDIVRGKGIQFNGQTIAFESIRSVSDGNYEMGLGIPSQDPELPVLATSFSMVSLMEPIMENGYGFCLFDKAGLTLFHSDMKRNLNEDFLMETGQVFNPYIKAGVDQFSSVRYMGREHYMYVKKLQDIEGYYLATFLEQSHTYSPNAIALNTTAEMQMAYLLLMLLIYWILFLLVRRKNKLKQHTFIYYWLRPMTFSGADGYRYRKLLFFNLCVLMYLLVTIGAGSLGHYPPELLIHAVISTGSLLILFNFWALAEAFPEKDRIYSQWHSFRKSGFIWIMIGLYLGCLILGRLTLSTDLPVPGEIFLCLLVGIGIWLIIKKNRGSSTFDQKKSLTYYKLYATSLVVLFSVVPMLLLFSINYNIEQDILFKSDALALKQRIDSWEGNKASQFYKEQQGISRTTVASLSEFVQQMAYDGSLSYAIDENTKITGWTGEAREQGTNLYATLYQVARFEFDQYGLDSRALIDSENQQTKQWSFVDRGLNFSETSDRIIKPIKSFPTLLDANWPAIGIFLVLLILMIYVLLTAVIHKVFGLDFKKYADEMVLPRDYSEIAKKLQEVYQKADEKNDAFNNSFIVGVNTSHTADLFDSLKKWKQKEFYSFDFFDLGKTIQKPDEKCTAKAQDYLSNSYLDYQILISSLIKSDNKNNIAFNEILANKHRRTAAAPIMLFVEHFEFAYDDFLLNKIKIDILQRIVSNPNIRLVVSSEISPTKMLEFYEDQIKDAENLARADKSLASKEKVETLIAVYKQWLQLFGGFYRITIPIELKGEKGMNCLHRELKHGQYLNRINNKYKVLYPTLNYCDDYVLNVQETAYTYYYAIWNSLTSEERYIVYDIAQDGFVNTNNVNGIIDLLHKGILVYDHSLHLMNESFTNFVLTKVSSDEALERELESNKKGNWSTASAVLILVIISLIAFISLGKINILQDVNALLTSLAAIIAVFLRLGGMFITGKAKE